MDAYENWHFAITGKLAICEFQCINEGNMNGWT